MQEQTEWVGKQLGHYRLMGLIGKGGFADVYLGEHVHLTTRSAIKLLHTRLSNDDVENFRREAQMIARLVHPSIVRVFDFGVENNVPYLVMDYASNGTLRHRHARGVALPLATVVVYVEQLAEALYYAHEQRLIHRDVKPENMLIGNRQEVLLSDFGIALVSQTSNYQHTQNIAGTIAYMAPEQIQAHPRPASDQYALGVVVYEWLSGQRPFQGSFSELAVKHVITPPPALRTQAPTISAAVEDVVMRALQKDPQQRFPNVRAFAQALQQASQQGSMYRPISSAFLYPQSTSPAYSAPLGAQQTYSPNSVQPATLPTTNSTPFIRSFPSATSTPPISFTQTQPPTYPIGQSFSTVSPMPQPKSISRRALFAGVLGLVAASSAATWYVSSLSRVSSTATPGVTATNPLAKITNTAAPSSPVLTYSAQHDYVWSVDWSPDGKYIISGSHDGTAQVWNATTGQRLLSYRSAIKPAMSDNWAWAVAWSPDSKKVAVGFIDGTVQTIDIASGELTHTYGQYATPPVYAVSWSPAGDHILATAGDSVNVYEVSSEKLVTTFDKHTNAVTTAAWSHDGKWIASGSTDGKVKVWQPLTGEEQLNYTEHSGDVRGIAWSHDSTRVASVSWDATAKVWEAITGHTLYTYSEQPVPQMMDSVSWSHHDKYVAFGGHDIYLRICDASTGKLVQSFTTYPAYSQAWSPDDKLIVTAGLSDKKVQIWQVQ